MLWHIRPELDAMAARKDSNAYSERFVVPGDADVDEQVRTAALSRTVLKVTPQPPADKINLTFSPSLEKEPGDLEVPETEMTTYSPPLNLELHRAVPPNELGVWVHRLYQVYLLQPELLDKALSMKPVCVTDDAQKREIVAHLEGFKCHVNAVTEGVRLLKCELQVTGLKPNGQVVSGEIDMLVEGETGWWLFDHKTDTNADAINHIDQLLTYRQMCGSLKVDNLAINWSRSGQLEAFGQ
jgi:ATP-dependent exoDNAse (exonuclease V) beta subunit